VTGLSAHMRDLSRISAMIGLAFALLAGATDIAGAIECATRAGSGGHWAWREIDGRRCWYRGQPGMSKSNLHWRESREVTNGVSPDDTKPVAVAEVPDGRDDDAAAVLPRASAVVDARFGDDAALARPRELAAEMPLMDRTAKGDRGAFASALEESPPPKLNALAIAIALTMITCLLAWSTWKSIVQHFRSHHAAAQSPPRSRLRRSGSTSRTARRRQPNAPVATKNSAAVGA
jgi:hypothetical protein